MLIAIFVIFGAISQCVSINFIDLPGFGDDELEYVEHKDGSAEDEVQSGGTNPESDGINEETDELRDPKDEGAEKKIGIKDDKDVKKNNENKDKNNEAKDTKHGIEERIDDVKEIKNEIKDNKNETKDEFKDSRDSINDSKNKIKDTNDAVKAKTDEMLAKTDEVESKNDEASEKKDEVKEKTDDVTEKKAGTTEKNDVTTEKKDKNTEKEDEVTKKNVEVTTAKNKKGGVDDIPLAVNGRRYWKVSPVPTTSTTSSAWVPDKDENIKNKITSLVQQTMHDTETKVKSVQKLQERHREKPAYRVGFILSMLKKSRDVLNQLFNIAVKHRDQWRALEQLKIFELIVHTNVDSTNLVRQLVEIHLIHVNNKNGNNKQNQNPNLRSQVVLM